MGSVSKERLFGATIRAAEERARETRKVADVIVEFTSKRIAMFQKISIEMAELATKR